MAFRNLSAIMFAAVLIAVLVAFVLSRTMQQDTGAKDPAPTVAVATQHAPPPVGTRSASIDRDEDGLFWTRADVTGTQVTFMVDTGASTVALTYFDAQRLGLKPEELNFDIEIRTAGGIVYGAPVVLPSIRIGKVKIEDVDAVVLRTELEQSLLGMTFLGELGSYEVRQGQMIIRQ